jgi:trigger factor
LKIETVALDDQQTRLVAELDVETMEKYKRQAARKVSQSTKIPGFRPGKAPYEMVRRLLGDERLTQEAVELLLDEVYPKVLAEANINPSGPGKLEEIVSMDPPTFAFIVPLPPEVTLADYQSIRKEYAPEPVTDEQVDQTLRRIQRSYSTAEPVERAAQNGDLVAFKLSAKRTQVEEGEKDMLLEQSPYQMVAGEDDEDEAFPYEGFSSELIGLSAGDTKTLVHTFSEESSYEDLRGKEAEFTISVDNVKEMHLSELNDDFAQTMGEFKTLDELKATIRQQLEQNYAQQYDQNYFDELIEMVVKDATVKYPPHMLDEEVEQFLHGVEHNLERDRLDLETYLKMREIDRETFIETEVKPAATKRLVRSLVLEEFARREAIEVKNEEIRSVYYAALQQMQQSTELKQIRSKQKQSPRDMANSIAMNTVNNIFNQRLTARLKAIAMGKADEPVEIVEATEVVAEEAQAPAAEAEVSEVENIEESAGSETEA